VESAVDSVPIEPRPVTLTLAGIRSLTILEVARACAITDVRYADAQRLIRDLGRPEGADPAELARGTELAYALALMLERRRDPALTWEQAQTWALVFDLDAADPIADAEAEATVAAAVATGLPPDVAGALTIAQADAYGELAARARRNG
jgi:hypothetical protein